LTANVNGLNAEELREYEVLKKEAAMKNVDLMELAEAKECCVSIDQLRNITYLLL
jgi:hypothetical protein